MKYDIYNNTAYKIGKYLSQNQQDNGSFPVTTYCAETFSILLWSHFKDEFKINIRRALRYYITKNKRGDCLFPFSWEFNNYVLLHYYLNTKDYSIYYLIRRLRFTGIKVANWTLLRAVCRFLKGGFLNAFKANLELKKILYRFQKNGFVFDEKGYEKGSMSFQYHSYSTALLGEIYEITGKEFVRERFLQGVDYIIRFILPNGDTLYIGRGQEQIFGYGALIYILEYAYKLTNKPQYKWKAAKVMSFLLGFQRENGSFPLVLRKEERGYPEVIDTEDERFLGWYRHNTYFDYLAFLGYYLIKTSKLNVTDKNAYSVATKAKEEDNFFTWQDDNFLLFSNPVYTAVISRPGGRWSNDMPFPYVCYKSESIFPCYGGEQLVKSIYSTDAIPLPFGISKDRIWGFHREILFTVRKIYYSLIRNSHLIPKLKRVDKNKLVFRDKLKYKLIGDKLIGKSRYVDHIRIFEFQQDTITIKDEINFKKSCEFDRFYPINYLFFDVIQITDTEFTFRYKGVEGKLLFSNPCYIEEEAFYCARGELKAVREKIGNVQFNRSDSIVRSLTIEFR